MTALQAELADPAQAETRARRIVELMATVLQGSLLVRDRDPAVADVFTASRLAGGLGPRVRHAAGLGRTPPPSSSAPPPSPTPYP